VLTGHVNVLMGFPKYRSAKRMRNVDIMGTPRLGMSVPQDMMVDKCMCSFGQLGLRRGAAIHLDTWVREGERHPQRT
jgi:hypothetical protein